MLSWVEGGSGRRIEGSNKCGKSNEKYCYIIVIKSFTFPIDSLSEMEFVNSIMILVVILVFIIVKSLLHFSKIGWS